MEHWRKSFNPNYIGAYAFQPGEEKVVTIKTTDNEEVTNQDGKKEQCLVAHFKEAEKPLILNVTNCKKNVFSMEELAAANNADIEQYQKEYNAAREEAENLKKQYFKKMIEAGKIIEASNHRRLEYMKLAGIKNLYLSKVENRGFKYVRSSFRGQFTPDEQNEIQQIDPNGILYINAMRS